MQARTNRRHVVLLFRLATKVYTNFRLGYLYMVDQEEKHYLHQHIEITVRFVSSTVWYRRAIFIHFAKGKHKRLRPVPFNEAMTP